MNVLLTGGAGFIGSHICVELLNAGDSVIVADNFSNSSPEAIENIKKITGKELMLYTCDVCDKDATEKIFLENKIDAVIHLAGLKAVGESVEKPLNYYRNNVCGVVNLLEVMRKYGCNAFVFSSSATVYGDRNTPPYREDFSTGAVNPYGRTKLMTEEILLDEAAARKELSVVILRYFNPIGSHGSGLLEEAPSGVPNNLFPYIIKVAEGNLPHLNVFGNDYPTPDGTGVRDYIHVCDLAKGHLAALKYAESHNGAEIFNLGTGHGVSVLELVNAYERVNGVKIPYVIAPRRSGDIAECYASAQKAKEKLGWEANLTIDDMVKRKH